MVDAREESPLVVSSGYKIETIAVVSGYLGYHAANLGREDLHQSNII